MGRRSSRWAGSAAGLEPQGNELPDFLPLFLDYCSTLPDIAAREALAEPGVDRISIGGLTKDVKATDYSMRFEGI